MHPSHKRIEQEASSLRNQVEPLLPKHVTPHPLGCHRKRVDDRSAMNAIFFVLKTGCQWNALNATGICSSSSAHRRFQEWNKAGVFRKLWKKCLRACSKSFSLKPQKSDTIQGIPVILHTLYAQKVPE